MRPSNSLAGNIYNVKLIDKEKREKEMKELQEEAKHFNLLTENIREKIKLEFLCIRRSTRIPLEYRLFYPSSFGCILQERSMSSVKKSRP